MVYRPFGDLAGQVHAIGDIMTGFYLVVGFCGLMCIERDASRAPYYTKEDCVKQAIELKIEEKGGYFRCEERKLER